MKMTEKLLPKWETFLDPAYYNCWAVRLEGDLSFNATFHLVNGDEAKALVEFLNRRSPLPAVEGGWRELLREALPHVIDSADYDDEGRVGNAVEAARDLVSRIDAALRSAPPALEKTGEKP